MRWQPPNMKKYLQESASLYLFVSVLFLMGVVFGAMLVNALSLEQQQDLSRALGQFFQSLDRPEDPDASRAASFAGTFWSLLKWIILIWALGLSVIGLPFVLIVNFIKGVLIGFSVGYLVGQYSWKGLLFTLTAVVPQNLLAVPALLVTSAAAISFSLFLIRHHFFRHRGSVSRQFAGFNAVVIVMAVVMAAVSAMETFVTPELLRWVAPRLVGA
jgi:stage II sporulation protein M